LQRKRVGYNSRFSLYFTADVTKSDQNYT